MLALMGLMLLGGAPRLAPITPDQVEAAPVAWLSVPQLEAEHLRLQELPSVRPANALITVGTVLSMLGAGITALTFLTSNDPTATFTGLGFALATGFSGVLLGNVGGALMPVLRVRHDRAAERRAAIQQHLDDIRAGRAQPAEAASPELLAEVRELVEGRPGLVFPSALVTSGTLFLAFGAPLLATGLSALSENPVVIGFGVGLTCLGLGLAAYGIWTLIAHLRERDEIDTRVDELRQTLPSPAPAG